MKKPIALGLILACLASLAGCSSKMTFSITEASKIELRSGNSGTTVEIMDEEDIMHITDSINTLQFSKGGACKDSTGWRYWLKWYDSENNLIEEIVVISEYNIDYKNYFYTIMDSDAEIDLLFFDELLSK